MEIEMNPLVGHVKTLADLKSEIHRLRINSSPRTEMQGCPRVPNSLLQSDSMGSEPSNFHHYEPMVMSLGPYHHGDSNLVRGEKIKLLLAVDFLNYLKDGESCRIDNQPVERPVHQPVEQPVDQPLEQPTDQPLDRKTQIAVDELYRVINGLVIRLKGCYDKEFTEKYKDEEFSLMMLVDGCALLRYMIYACIDHGYNQEKFNIRYEDLSRLHRDALLLENQLPYQLLCELMDRFALWKRADWEELWLQFCGMTEFKAEAYSFLQKKFLLCSGQVTRLTPNSQIIKRRRRPILDEESGSVLDREHSHLLDLYLKKVLRANHSSPTCGEDSSSGMGSIEDVKEQFMASFRNVKELMAAGIRIKPSHTRYLSDISFTSYGITACLRLPSITIDESTKTLFFNFIAWEMSSNQPHDFISYLRFLDSLIDNADDIKELQSAGVLQNSLGTHEEVADFFNTVSAKLVSNFRAYSDVRGKIRKHLKSHRSSKVKRWLTECLDIHFGSPWTIIAWGGAALILFFTAVQTYFAAFSH
ncbi:uncharacterized protein LOC117932662 [Vitis riparia]|uniref:uncharacterized protein LOC117932662 n=1 Tax=Vitis riparia TaxID=96939 RepID=UPI00155B233C|nr:uncharacterized protein LOC117932662 [Vitis riparia]